MAYQLDCDRQGAFAGRLLTIRIVRVAPDGDALDTDGVWGRVCQLDPDGAVLVRPDGFIAWRAQRVSFEGLLAMAPRVMKAMDLASELRVGAPELS